MKIITGVIFTTALIALSCACAKEEPQQEPQTLSPLAVQTSAARDAQMRRGAGINASSGSDLPQKDTTRLIGTNASGGAEGYGEKRHPGALVIKNTNSPSGREIKRAKF